MPRTPQQNGIVEKISKTLTKRAKSLRIQARLSKQFGVEAINTTTYLINQGPSTPLEHKIPKEVWIGKEIKLSYLKVFGCLLCTY